MDDQAGATAHTPADPRLGALREWLANRLADGPVDLRERASLRRFAAELDVLARPFDQDAGPVHVTASAIVTGPEGVLLHRHKRLGLWLQPGGHLEPGEEPMAAARRELHEETGLAGRVVAEEPVHVDVHGGGRGHVHLDVRWLVEAAGPPDPPAGESQDVRWFAWDEAIQIADAGLAALLRAARPSAGSPGSPTSPGSPSVKPSPV